MGLMQRRKGRSYEQRIANVLRAKWPGIEVRRSSQADRAVQSDVYVANGNATLERIWWELTDARKPDPIDKLEQAERDIAVGWAKDLGDPEEVRSLSANDAWVQDVGFYCTNRLPVVVWHRIGERTSYATTRLWVLDAVRGARTATRSEAVTMDLDAFLDVLSGGVR